VPCEPTVAIQSYDEDGSAVDARHSVRVDRMTGHAQMFGHGETPLTGPSVQAVIAKR